jgi:dTDP-4-dehydrorhamnose 3,5-epimerase
MLVQTTKLKDCVIIEPSVFGDNRGFFLETFSRQRYFEEAGIELEFVQDNHSRSAANVLRGLHFQKTKPQGKLIRVVRGCVFDVAVDIRPGSDTFGQWISMELSEQNKKQLWVPPGFAHGFTALNENTELE